MRSLLRLRLGGQDAHYGGGLVDGARLLALCGDAATELCILAYGDEGLFRAYDAVEFLAPACAGDFVEVVGEITRWGGTSLGMQFEVRKVLTARADVSPSAADHLAPAVVLLRARGTCVVPKPRQRTPSRPPPLIITAAIVGA